jgi:hypothetical protein
MLLVLMALLLAMLHYEEVNDDNDVNMMDAMLH